ncbi:hypothetical protein [Treponema sp. OMZ 788]|nr:hypothetical protein [Treponema sp. OMZ 788]
MKSILVQIILLIINCVIPDPIPFIDEIIQIIILILTIIGKVRKS